MTNGPDTRRAPEELAIVTICGSLRSGSYNAAVARTLPALAPDGMHFTVLEGMAGFPLYHADLGKADIPQVVTDWAQWISAADGVVIVMPEYNYSVPGVLKNALDWLSRDERKPFEGKPVAIQTASTGQLGGVRAQYHLRQIMVYLGALVMNRPEIMIGNAMEKFGADGGLADPVTRDLISQQLAAFERWILRVGGERP